MTPALKRELGLLDSTMIVVGSMIGSGIFIVSADIGRTMGSTGWLLAVWVITGVITIMAALSYGELAGMMPKAGGQYVYLREAYNPLVGFLFGWTLFLVIQTGTIAAVAVAFAKYAAVLLPWFSEKHVVLSIGSKTISGAQILAIGIIVLLTGVNLRGIKEGKVIQNIFTITKVAAILGLILLGITIGRNPEAIASNLQGFWDAKWLKFAAGETTTVTPLSGLSLWTAIGVAMVGSLFSADAWNNITFTAGEVTEPQRNIPLSLAFGTIIVISLYMLANIAYLCVLPLHGSPYGGDVIGRGIQFATNDRVAAAAAQQIFGGAGTVIMAILIMISTFGCNNGLILSGARVYYAMAQDGLFFKRVATLNENAVPSAALVLQAIWASVLCLSGNYGDLLDYVIFAVLIFYILTVGGIFLLRKKMPDAPRPYKAWGYPYIPGAYIVLASLIALDLLVFKPNYTWPGIGIVLMGIPVFYVWRSSTTAAR